MDLIKIVFITYFMSLLPFALQASEESPGKIVKQTVDQVLSVLKDKNLDEEKQKEMVFKLVKDRINFKEMSRRILATNWNVADEKQRKEFMSLFEQILLNTYWERIRRFAGERVEYVSVNSDNEDYATVDTIIVKGKTDIEIPISYRMKRFVNIWFAYDFTVERLSLVQSYRNEYRAIAKNNGVDGLLEQMKRDVVRISSRN
ncbi:MAG: phospholipid transport system substrate-binding protein [Gammaproteobacteria bacterium]|jgi:phospholipid transport system substrate-binding protein